MHDIMNLKEMLMDELSEYGRKGELNAKTLETVDTLAHATKNLCKIIESAEDEEYSERGRSSYERGGSSYRGGNSYARGGRGRSSYENMYEGDSSYENSYARGRGRNARRDRMGRYSRDDAKDEMVQNLRTMAENAPDEQTRMGIERLMQQMEQ